MISRIRFIASGLGTTALGLTLLASSGASNPAHAISCGDTLGPGGSFKLDVDLVDCPRDAPALTIVGPVRVNMAGHSVSCGEDANDSGIEITGRRARLSNGEVTGCVDGVLASGLGQHVIWKVTSTQNSNYGFRLVGGGPIATFSR